MTTSARIDAALLEEWDPFPLPGILPASPLAEAVSFDFRRPVPLGVDSAVAPVTLALAGANLVIAGAVCSGVSRAAQHAAAAAALDPAAELSVFDRYGLSGADWWPFAKVATRIVDSSGGHDGVLEALTGLAEGIEERHARTSAGGAAEAGRFAPHLVVVASAEHFTCDHVDGPAITEVLAAIARRGPGIGYSLLLTSHWPESFLYRGEFRHAIEHRLVLHEPDAHRSAVVLGEGVERRLGVSAGDLRRLGSGILSDGREGRPVHGYFLDNDSLKGIYRHGARGRRRALTPRRCSVSRWRASSRSPTPDPGIAARPARDSTAEFALPRAGHRLPAGTAAGCKYVRDRYRADQWPREGQ